MRAIFRKTTISNATIVFIDSRVYTSIMCIFHIFRANYSLFPTECSSGIFRLMHVFL